MRSVKSPSSNFLLISLDGFSLTFETQLLNIQLWYCLKENVRANLASKMKNTYLKHLK